ncbi:hypothetical protein CP965_02345 [Halarcobacter mediterraneus]|uniref:Transglycosylase SLT domain-containing protein n=1 Tax=Halarcobacter mediterraneus TaxID=2023153 RepID=A0A4Q1B1S6_9BACT|nr:hypothetical protein [Halarcobacter mediterraneus]RXK14311.1 hypothetical protein CP965_02345 [Halarcobacter mediterraneus]
MKTSTLFLSTFLIVNLYSQEVEEKIQKPELLNLEKIEKENKGIKRDFLINKYLKQDSISSEQAFEVLKLIDNMNLELFENFAKKFGHDETLAVMQCIKMPLKQLINSYPDCISLGLTNNEALTLNSIELNVLIKKLYEKYPDFSKRLKVLNAPIPFTKLISLSSSNFYKLFFNLKDSYIEKHFNYKLPKSTLNKIIKDKENFQRLLIKTLKNQKLDMLNKSFYNLDFNYNEEVLFSFAMNSYFNQNLELSSNFLQEAKKFNTLKNNNKYNFWLFKVTKDESYLKEILENSNINIYTIFAKELLNKNNKIILYTENKMLEESMKKITKENQAFLYSLAKVESNLNENFISSSFKTGIFQTKKSLKTDIKSSIENMENKLNNIEEENPLIKYLIFKNKEKIVSNVIETKDKYLALELIPKNEKIKEFLFTYYLYYSNKNNNFKLNSLFSESKKSLP